MSNSLFERLRQLHRIASASAPQRTTSGDERTYAWLQEVAEEHAQQTLEAVLKTPVTEWLDDISMLSAIWVELTRRQQIQRFAITDEQLGEIATIYRQLVEHESLRSLLLRFLAASNTTTSLQLSAELLVADPPRSQRLLLETFGDLIRCADRAIPAVFPRLLDGLNQPNLAVFVLDFSNFAHRQGHLERHPAADRSAQLSGLLSGLAGRLDQLQETSPATSAEVVEMGRQVTESVALGVSLCDALGLIGDREAVASLFKALQVEHRRLRVEAAAALARLGEEAGLEVLPALAAEPAERLRALAYAEELGLLDKVADEYASPTARAEAELVMHLAEPTQFGLAPHHVELVDEREQKWPGFDDPQHCFLFQFAYHFPSGEYTNIGIAGPVVFSFHADLTALAHDDVYALLAGWHTEHPDVFAVEPSRAVGQDQVELGRLQASLSEAGYEDPVPTLLGHFLGRRVLICAARRNGVEVWAMVSDDSYDWVTQGNPVRPIGATEAFHVFVGRQLLASFNAP